MKIVKNRKACPICMEKQALEGVRRIAGVVCEDIRLVTGVAGTIEEYDESSSLGGKIVIATYGHSDLLSKLEAEGKFASSELVGKREVYRIEILKEAGEEYLVIAGSDKRGTIYGLFALSEALGVSPFVYWADAVPTQVKEPEVPASLIGMSKEPSVRYRGFFINDEFPSFGNWTIEKFGGFTAEMYDYVFQLLLRLKGNYIWPAMWVSSFPLDGPGLLNAELADLYGVVIGNSHHEPCLRASEEWDKVKGPDSVYGQEWNYYTNREGLLRYWEDGLKRSGRYEGIITVGMRGERDSSMLGEDATLKQNIDLLKDIITEQKKLIRKHVNEDLSKVPMMLALYKEVEAYYYGDETTEGLKDWDGLEDIILMLCEDNYGNMRTLPTAENREHAAGFGMYYHFDYHGGPISYEWVNSTPIAKTWEQMCEAYEYGIRDIWIVNVGDLKPQELPLSFFMNLAYDFDTYGTAHPNETGDYTQKFARSCFKDAFIFEGERENDVALAAWALEEYTRLNGIRRPEALNKDVYHPVHFEESRRMIERADRLEKVCLDLRSRCKEAYLPSFTELIFYPAVASANLLRMQLWAGLNAFYGKKGMVYANSFQDKVEAAIAYDGKLIEEYHSLLEGKWNHMMSSKHVGFVNWNDEGSDFPKLLEVKGKEGIYPAVRIMGESVFHREGTLICRIPCNAGERKVEFVNEGNGCVHYVVGISGECVCDKADGAYEDCDEMLVTFPAGEEGTAGSLWIHFENGTECEVRFERVKPAITGTVSETCLGETMKQKLCGIGSFLVLDAGEYAECKEAAGASYKLLKDYGKFRDSAKVFPVTRSFTRDEVTRKAVPTLCYDVNVAKAGTYECRIYVSPTNPLYPGDAQQIAVWVNEGEPEIRTTLPEGFEAGNCHNPQWNENVLEQIRMLRLNPELKEGENRIHIGAVDAGVILQRMVVVAPGEALPESYLLMQY